MPRPKPTEPPEDLRALTKEYRISWLGFVDEAVWPEAHKATFSHIRQRGHQDFDIYSEDSDVRVHDEPWRAQTRDRALRIVRKAERCLSGAKNEAGWRFDIEPEVLRRFEIEVACQKCRARLWRSEVEAHINPNETFAQSLEERRSSRTACTCRMHNQSLEPGLNNLFDSKAQESIVFDEAVAKRLPSGKEPDRVYGLNPSRRFERIMARFDKRPSANGRRIAATIASTPFKTADRDVIFPFLVLEAKSENFNGGFSTTRTQSAFAIRALLNLQHNLKKAAGKESQWESGPLVWFFMNCGEQWRVAAAYVDGDSTGDICYRIVDLWRGNLDEKSGALQLLLIVDYIFDWARDVYRTAILSELTALVEDITPSLADDSEIASVAHGMPFLFREETDGEDDASHFSDNTHEITGSIPGFDSSKLRVVRDATWFSSQFFGLVVTKDDVEPMMACWNAPSMAKKQARHLQPVLQCSWRLTEETIRSLEQRWTGKIRESSHVFGTGETFYAIITVCSYLSQTWVRILELSCLAISENAIKEFQSIADWKNGTVFEFGDAPVIDDNSLCVFLEAARQGSTGSALWAALNRSCMSSSRTSLVGEDDAIPFRFTDENPERQLSDPNAPIMTWNHKGEVRDFVVNYYQRYKIGRKEPTEAFIRTSRRAEQQSRVLGASVWEPRQSHVLENNHVAVAYEAGKYVSFERRGLCLFLIDGVNPSALRRFNMDDIAIGFQVVLESTTIGYRGSSYKPFWNEKNISEVLLTEMKEQNKHAVRMFCIETEGRLLRRLLELVRSTPAGEQSGMIGLLSVYGSS